MKMKSLKGTTRRPWDAGEINQLLELYDAMLALQASGEKWQKAPLVRLTADLLGRSKGSIEAKLMNASAVRAELGLDVVKGYKPLANMQLLLRELARARWSA